MEAIDTIEKIVLKLELELSDLKKQLRGIVSSHAELLYAKSYEPVGVKFMCCENCKRCRLISNVRYTVGKITGRYMIVENCSYCHTENWMIVGEEEVPVNELLVLKPLSDIIKVCH